MRKYILFLFFFLPAISFSQSLQEKIKEKNHDIHFLNLLIGLELDNSQSKAIYSLCKQYKAENEAILARNTKSLKTLSLVLSQIQSELMSGSEISKETKKQYRAVKENISQIQLEARLLETNYAHEILDRLKPWQRTAMESFVPCTIPPDGPNRIGQAKDNATQRMLEKIYDAPEDLYLQEKDELALRFAQRNVLHTNKGEDINVESEQQRILNFFEHIRKMEEMDFLMQKEELAEQLKNKKKRDHLPSDTLIIIKYFLDKNAVPLIRDFYRL